jgi:anti-anti-sigma regulatory factor
MIEFLMQKPEMTSEQGVTIISPGPDYDSIYESSLSQFDHILDLAKTVEPPRMIMDLTHTEYFGSAFLGLLIRISNRLTVQRKGRFGVCHLSKFCRTVITVSKVDTLFELFETRADAIAAFTKDDES